MGGKQTLAGGFESEAKVVNDRLAKERQRTTDVATLFK